MPEDTDAAATGFVESGAAAAVGFTQPVGAVAPLLSPGGTSRSNSSPQKAPKRAGALASGGIAAALAEEKHQSQAEAVDSVMGPDEGEEKADSLSPSPQAQFPAADALPEWPPGALQLNAEEGANEPCESGAVASATE